jgi:hypothetical protein
MPHINAAPHQQSVAVPTNAMRAATEIDGGIIAMFQKHMVRNGAGALTKTAVRLLQRDDIGVDFAQHRQHPVGVAPPVYAHAFADIIGRDL